MKKIGIMSMQRIINYGSFLQAYSLKSTIESLGYKVEFVDYKIEPCIDGEVKETEKKKNLFYLFLRNIWMLRKKRGRMYSKSLKFEKRFKNKYLLELGITSERNERPKLDTLVIGSDEVFNCFQNNPDVGYSLELFGKDNNANKIITYAACFGNTTYEMLLKYNKVNEISKLISHIDNISVRDNNSANIMDKLCNKTVVFNLDPVFIYNYDKLIPSNIKLSDFIIVYAYANRFTEKEVQNICNVAKKLGKKIVSIGTLQTFCDKYIPAHPFELLGYIKKADYIITDTFHGTVFSIKYNKQFVTIIRDSNKQKVGDLLERFSLNDRIINNLDDIEGILVEPINYSNTNKIIKSETNKALEYLKNNL